MRATWRFVWHAESMGLLITILTLVESLRAVQMSWSRDEVSKKTRGSLR